MKIADLPHREFLQHQEVLVHGVRDYLETYGQQQGWDQQLVNEFFQNTMLDLTTCCFGGVTTEEFTQQVIPWLTQSLIDRHRWIHQKCLINQLPVLKSEGGETNG